MSWVTNLMLHISVAEEAEERLEEVNHFFEEMPHAVTGEVEEEPPLVSVESLWEGKGRDFETNVYIGAYNYFPLEKFLAHLRNIAWEEPQYIQLFVQDQEDMEFQVHKIMDKGE